jgi:hypothetical protein
MCRGHLHCDRHPSSNSCIGLARTVYIHTPYMTVYLMISLPEIPYIHRIHMVLANPTHVYTCRKYGLFDHTHFLMYTLFLCVGDFYCVHHPLLQSMYTPKINQFRWLTLLIHPSLMCRGQLQCVSHPLLWSMYTPKVNHLNFPHFQLTLLRCAVGIRIVHATRSSRACIYSSLLMGTPLGSAWASKRGIQRVGQNHIYTVYIR